jgi:hypothetical protein
MLRESIQAELRRLQLQVVNLDAVSEIDGSVLLKGSLLAYWQVPKSIDGQWFLKVLTGLPDLAGPEATMDAYYEAFSAEADPPHSAVGGM